MAPRDADRSVGDEGHQATGGDSAPTDPWTTVELNGESFEVPQSLVDELAAACEPLGQLFGNDGAIRAVGAEPVPTEAELNRIFGALEAIDDFNGGNAPPVVRP